MHMNFLMIDTSTEKSFIALYKNGELKVEHLPPKKQSQTLLPAIENLLENEEIEWIAIGIGPGSFTGTRVGVMTAKTLAFAKNIPLLPFCSLKIFTPDADGPFTLHTDAKSQGVYVLKGEKTGRSASYLSPTVAKEGGPLSTTLNLPFLASYLLEKFNRCGGVSHQKITVAYSASL